MIAMIFYLLFILTGIAHVEPEVGMAILAVLAACEAPFWLIIFGREQKEQYAKIQELERKLEKKKHAEV